MEMAFIVLIVVLLGLGLWLWVVMEHGILPKKSTRDFWHLSDLSPMKKIEGYIYAARTSWYLKPVTWPWFMRFFSKAETADTYHGKLITRQDAGKLISLNQPVAMESLDQVIPFPIAKQIILQSPMPSIAVMECPCRAQQENPCQPTDVCLVVGEPFASFVVDHQPGHSRRIKVEEALEIIAQEERRGHIHTAWFKDVMHNRFYAICNCCTCCCLGMKSFFRDVPRLIHSGYTPTVDAEECTACGGCESICPFHAIDIGDALPAFNLQLCMGCGLCVSHCPNNAIHLTLAPERGTPLNIEILA